MSLVLVNNADFYVESREVPKNHTLSLLQEIFVEPGTKKDWDLLHELHYKAESVGIGPRFWKITLRGKTIGVGVMTVPKMLLSGRNELFVHLRPNVNGKDNRLINRHRAMWLNENMCTNSRLVIDTMYRGAGIAYKAQNLMMRLTGCSFIEFQSSMSKFNPFAAKAGIQFSAPRRASNYQRGLELFRRWFDAVPTDYIGVMEEIEAMPEPMREKCVAELRRFYYMFSSMEKSGNNRRNGTTRVDGLTVGKLLKNLQQLAFASPLYGVYVNPDVTICPRTLEVTKNELPQRLRVLAFDNQRTDEPLDISKLVVGVDI